ncbi:MAG: hypothetical protein FWH17_06390 [Oscillospiraceae bacterium]|nr:hypothetical protein [Oscillospiraceae bacterium]
MDNKNNVTVKTSIASPELSLKSINRVSAVYNICYEIFKIFHAPKSTFRILYDGIMDEHVLKKMTLYFISPDDIVEFMLILSIDLELHNVIMQTSNVGSIQVNKQLSTVEQLVGNREGFKQLYKEMMKTKRIKTRIVTYRYITLSSDEHKRIDKKLGLKTLTGDFTMSGRYRTYKITPKQLSETSLTIRVRKNDMSPSAMRHFINILRSFWDSF